MGKSSKTIQKHFDDTMIQICNICNLQYISFRILSTPQILKYQLFHFDKYNSDSKQIQMFLQMLPCLFALTQKVGESRKRSGKVGESGKRWEEGRKRQGRAEKGGKRVRKGKRKRYKVGESGKRSGKVKIETFVFVWNQNCICQNGITNISIFMNSGRWSKNVIQKLDVTDGGPN